VGQDYIADLFKEDVEVTEKVDGSQFVFGRVDGEVQCRSKGQMLYEGAVQKMFVDAFDYAHSVDLPNETIFYGEYLQKPKHNTLKYERIPLNHIAIFGASTPGGTFISCYEELAEMAGSIGLEAVPLIYSGRIKSAADLQGLLETNSYLGGVKVEGVVVKNYSRPFLLGGQPIPVMCGKFVSEAFKEKHVKDWGKENTARGKWDVFKEGFRTDARWEKAVQHLRDDGALEGSPRDIGALITEVKRDIAEEERDAILKFLWSEFVPDLLRKSTAGLPEWYKTKLAEQAFEAGSE
jgi:hypothetical protein